ncbi:MAG: hypothetical protein JXQ87_11635 [Bacteroidia bacterium]
MEKVKSLFLILPEYLLLIAVVFYWISAGLLINPIAIALMAIIIIQIIAKNRILGLAIPGVLILVCVYMLLALFSEFNEFSTFNEAAQKLLVVGLTYFVSTIAVSTVMIYKYAQAKPTIKV